MSALEKVDELIGKTADPKPAVSEKKPDKIDPAIWRMCWILIAGMVAILLDSTITNIALDTLSRDFNTSMATVQWVSTAYMLAAAVAVPLAGWAEARLTGKKLWLIALSVFLVASIGAACSWSFVVLIVFRVLQGLAAAIATTLTTTLIMRATGGKKMGQVMATIGLPTIIIPILGPFVGGTILTYLNWHWMFWINVPLMALGIILAVRYLPQDERRPAGRIDLAGLALIGGGAALLLYGLSRAGAVATLANTTVLVTIGIGLVLIVGFAIRTTQSNHPLIDLTLFKRRSFTMAACIVTLSSFALYGGTLLMPLMYQRVYGYSVMIAGVALIPQGIGTLCSRQLAGKMTDRVGSRPVVAVSAGIAALATIPFAFISTSSPWWWLAICMLIRGFGLGGITLPAMTASYIGLDKAQIPSASIITRMMQQVGGAFGAAIAAIVLAWAMTALGDSLAGAFRIAFWVVTALTALVSLASLALSPKVPSES